MEAVSQRTHTVYKFQSCDTAVIGRYTCTWLVPLTIYKFLNTTTTCSEPYIRVLATCIHVHIHYCNMHTRKVVQCQNACLPVMVGQLNTQTNTQTDIHVLPPPSPLLSLAPSLSLSLAPSQKLGLKNKLHSMLGKSVNFNKLLLTQCGRREGLLF